MKMGKIIAVFFVLLLSILLVGSGHSEEDSSIFEIEPNDDFDTATSIEIGKMCYGTVSIYGDIDYWKISIPKEKTLIVGITSGNNGDIDVSLYNEVRTFEQRAHSEDESTASMIYTNTILDNKEYHTIYLKIEGSGAYYFELEYYEDNSSDSSSSDSSSICSSVLLVSMPIILGVAMRAKDRHF